jgi:hypothetical protein
VTVAYARPQPAKRSVSSSISAARLTRSG